MATIATRTRHYFRLYIHYLLLKTQNGDESTLLNALKRDA